MRYFFEMLLFFEKYDILNSSLYQGGILMNSEGIKTEYDQKITDTLRTNFMPYAMSVIVSRAIPEIDGLKPSHRKLLYTMYKMGLMTGARTKSSKVVGATMALNPHGDAAIYDTLVRLTRGNASLLYPFVDSKGSFGKKYSRDMASAAPRYTEVKLDEFAKELFLDIDKDTVNFVDNFDGTMKEPELLPVTFPNILANPNLGIAVGMASNICSFNLNELCETSIALMKDKNADITETLLAPDFPGGGQIVYDKEVFKEIYETGRGSFKVRSKYRYDKKNHCIEIYEIPYTTQAEIIIEAIAKLVKEGKAKEIADLRDETDLKGLKITIDVKRGTDPDKLMAFLYSKTPLEDSFGCNFNVLIKNHPRVMGVREILLEWLSFRMDCIKRRTKFDIDKKSHLLHLLYGLKKILLDIDKAVEIVRATENDDMVVDNLVKGFSIDEEQAEYVAEIKLRNFNKEYILKKISDVSSLEEEIKELTELLSSDAKIKKLIATELKAVSKKYGSERKSEIIDVSEIQEAPKQEEVEDYNVKIFLTRDGYLKKITLVSLRSASEQRLKDGDEILSESESTNRADLLLFSDKSNVYKIKISDLPDSKASSYGEYVPNIAELSPDEKIIKAVATTEYSGMLLFGFENGKVAKVPLSAYETKTNRKKLINAYSDLSNLVGMLFIPSDTNVVVESSNAKLLAIDSACISLKKARDTVGVKVMTLKKNTAMKDIYIASEAKVSDVHKYFSKNIPAAGFFKKAADRNVQTSLFDE